MYLALAKARRRELANFTGIDSDYEPPETPEISPRHHVPFTGTVRGPYAVFPRAASRSSAGRETCMTDTQNDNWIWTLSVDAAIRPQVGICPQGRCTAVEPPLTQADLASPGRDVVAGLVG